MPYNDPQGYGLQLPRQGRTAAVGRASALGPGMGLTDPYAPPDPLRIPYNLRRQQQYSGGRRDAATAQRVMQNQAQQQRLLELKRLSPRRYADVLQQLILGGGSSNRPPSSGSASLRNPASQLLAGYMGAAAQRPGLNLRPSGSGGGVSAQSGGGFRPPSWSQAGGGMRPPNIAQRPSQPIKRETYTPRFNWRGG